jgi:two-component system, LytTR family, sensor kinase
MTKAFTPRGRHRLTFAWLALYLGMVAFGTAFKVSHLRSDAPPVFWWSFLPSVVLSLMGDSLQFFAAIYLALRWPIAPPRVLRRTALHLMAMLVTTALVWLVAVIVAPIVGPTEWLALPPSRILLLGIVAYWIPAALAHGVELARRFWRADAARTRLKADLSEAARQRTEADLRALKAELNPRFLGDAMQTVSTLMRTDVAAADRVLDQLSQVLRSATGRGPIHEFTLGEQLDTLNPYLAIERERLGGRLIVERALAPETLDLLVPDMVLQPVVEDAIKRHISPGAAARICISSRQIGPRGELLEISVRDESTSSPESKGTRVEPSPALAQVASRLAELYGVRASLDLESGVHGVSVTRLIIPARDDSPSLIGAARATAEADGDHAVRKESLAGRRPIVRVLIAACLLAVWGTVYIASNRTYLHPDGTHWPLLIDVLEGLITAAMMTALTFTAFWLSRIYPLDSASAAGSQRPLAVHAVTALSFGSLELSEKFVFAWSMDRLRLMHQFEAHPVAFSLRIVLTWAGAYALYAGLAHGLAYVRRYGEASAAEEALRVELAEAARRQNVAELRALKAELNPHFLGNALNAVATLMRTDVVEADLVLGQLGELMRSAIRRTGTQEVTLGEELETLRPFLEVERARRGHQLEVKWNVDEQALKGRVPHMILQPLVENAAKHGLAARPGLGCIEIAARRIGERLELCVHDDGPGLEHGSSRTTTRHGVGLANTRARLAQLYQGSATLELVRTPSGGTVARLNLPWREAGEWTDLGAREALAESVAAAS